MALSNLLALPLYLGVITVGSSPSADYADLPAAVAAASPLDTLILSPGTYTPTLIDKPLSIIGADPGGSRPSVSHPSWSGWEISGPGPVTIQGIDFQDLRVENVKETVRLDDIQHL